MNFVPNHIVSYRGEYYTAGQKFQIDPKDAEEMSKYGSVEDYNPAKTATTNVNSEEDTDISKDLFVEQAMNKRPGRPRRV